MTTPPAPHDDGRERYGEIESARDRVLDGIMRRLRQLVIAVSRDYAYCGKAACKRSRRCRGMACEPVVGDRGDET